MSATIKSVKETVSSIKREIILNGVAVLAKILPNGLFVLILKNGGQSGDYEHLKDAKKWIGEKSSSQSK